MAWQQCVGITIFGWLPLTQLHALGDGHHDVVVLLLVLLWIYQLRRGHPAGAILSLTLSVMLKYVTAPLFLLDVLYGRATRHESVMTCARRLGASAVLMAIVFWTCMRSTDAFSATLGMTTWSFLSPRAAVVELARALRISPSIALLVPIPFVLFALGCIRRFLRQRTDPAFFEAILAVLCAVLFSAGHTWPWFLIWVAGVAALVPESPLTRWALAVALVLPLAAVMTRAFDLYEVSAYPTYILVLLCSAVLPRAWLRPSAAGRKSATGPG